MLNGLCAILKIGKNGGDWRPPDCLHGDLPDGVDLAQLHEACTAKPSLRKIGSALALVFPVAPQEWVIWLLDHVPPVTALPELMERAGRLTQDLRIGLVGAAGLAAPDETLVVAMLRRLAGSDRRDSASVAQILADAVVEYGLARAAIVAQIGKGRRLPLAFSDQKFAPLADELRYLIRQHMAGSPQNVMLSADDVTPAALDGAMLVDMLGSQQVLLDLPSADTGGLALVLCEPVALPADLRVQLDALAALASARKPPRPVRRQVLRAAVAAAGAALAIWLVLPAPLVVTATAISEPRGAVVMALPVAGFVDRVAVRIGDDVAQGAPVARFRAPDLEEQDASLGIELAMETVAAQSALATNDYGAFLLSQQKIEGANLRQQRLREKLAALDMQAPVTGRVVSALGPDRVGQYLPIGETIAVLQPNFAFSAVLTVSNVDAPLLAAGQQGQIWFRGISGQSWPLEIQTPVVQSTLPDGSGTQLTLRASIQGDDQSALFAGLAGYARVTVGEQMRLRVLSRYVTEYVRGKAWIWFGLMF